MTLNVFLFEISQAVRAADLHDIANRAGAAGDLSAAECAEIRQAIRERFCQLNAADSARVHLFPQGRFADQSSSSSSSKLDPFAQNPS